MAEEELVPCTFKEEGKNLGYLDCMDQQVKKKINEALPAGTKLDLPLWLGISLAQRDLAELRNPLCLSEKYMNNLKAGSEVVNFRLQSPNIYENILKLCAHLSEELVAKFITNYRNAFIERFKGVIFDMADSTEMHQNDQFTTDLKRFSNLEREIFEQHKRQRISFGVHKNKTQTR